MTVLSFFPDVFIGSGAQVHPFDKSLIDPRVDLIAHYAPYRQDQTSTQYADMLRGAKLPNIPLRFDWTIRSRGLVDELRDLAAGDPIVLVHGGRPPFGRTDGVGREILPRREAFETVLGMFADCFTVRVGKGEQTYPLPADVDLCNRTSVADLIDIASICDAIVTQCGFPIPLGECFDKPVLAIWSARGLNSAQPIIPMVTPRKILSKPTSRFVMDNWSAFELQKATHEFRLSMSYKGETEQRDNAARSLITT